MSKGQPRPDRRRIVEGRGNGKGAGENPACPVGAEQCDEAAPPASSARWRCSACGERPEVRGVAVAVIPIGSKGGGGPDHASLTPMPDNRS